MQSDSSDCTVNCVVLTTELNDDECGGAENRYNDDENNIHESLDH